MRLHAWLAILGSSLALQAPSQLPASPTALVEAESTKASPGQVQLAQRGVPRPSRPPPRPINSGSGIRGIGELPVRPIRPPYAGSIAKPYDRVMPVAGAAAVVGPITVNPKEAKFFLTRRGADIVLQSNYGVPEGRKFHPRAVVLDAVGGRASLERGIAIVLSDGQTALLPIEGLLTSRVRPNPLKNIDIIISEELIGPDGRPEIDVSGARSIRLARNSELIETGEIKTLETETPPPPLIETLSGCCFMGRPPGRRLEIEGRLSSSRVEVSNSRLLSLVVDSGTASVIRGSSILRSMSRGDRPGDGRWHQYLTRELAASRGKNLILLTHVLGSKVVVENPRGDKLYEIEISELHAMASRNVVNLILLGCETSGQMSASPLLVGVIGKYNTAKAAQRLAEVMASSRDGTEFMAAMATRDLIIVAQPGNWSAKAAGAALYGRARSGPERWIRLMRIWFLGGDGDG